MEIAHSSVALIMGRNIDGRCQFSRHHWYRIQLGRDSVELQIVTWIERTYHRRRRQARLGRLTPIEYETIIEPAALAA